MAKYPQAGQSFEKYCLIYPRSSNRCRVLDRERWRQLSNFPYTASVPRALVRAIRIGAAPLPGLDHTTKYTSNTAPSTPYIERQRVAQQQHGHDRDHRHRHDCGPIVPGASSPPGRGAAACGRAARPRRGRRGRPKDDTGQPVAPDAHQKERRGQAPGTGTVNAGSIPRGVAPRCHGLPSTTTTATATSGGAASPRARSRSRHQRSGSHAHGRWR